MADDLDVHGHVRLLTSHPIAPGGILACIIYLPSTCGFATGHSDNRVRVWGATGALEAALEGHRGSVVSLASLGPGKLVSGSSDGSVRVWEGSATTATLDFGPPVIRVGVRPACPNIVLASTWDFVRVWDLGTSASFDLATSGGAPCFDLLSDGSVIAGVAGGGMQVWGPGGEEKPLPTPAPPATVWGLIASGVGKFLVMSFVEDTDTSVVKQYVNNKEAWSLSMSLFWSPIAAPPHLALRGMSPQGMHELVFLEGRRGVEPGRVGFTRAGGHNVRHAACGDGKFLLYASATGVVHELEVVFKYARLELIHTMATAWHLHGGVPPLDSGCDPQLAAVARTLPLRRFCRPRGESEVGRPLAMVEPFARAIALFL